MSFSGADPLMAYRQRERLQSLRGQTRLSEH